VKKESAETKQSEKPTKGRAAFVHALREKGVAKTEAMAQAQERFACPKGLFDRIWKRGSKGAETEAKTGEKQKQPADMALLTAKQSKSKKRGKAQEAKS